MANRKFFSGLPDNMMKTPQGPNRQATNFYWPNDSETELNSFKTASRNRLRSRCTSSASLMSQSQASSDTEESRRRKLQQNDSYDFHDVPTDTESVVSSRDRNRRKKNETLSSKIQFYDFIDSPEVDDDVKSVIEKRPDKMQKDSVKSEKAVVNEQIASKFKKSIVDIENLTKDIENMDIKSSGKKPPYQYVDSYSDESDDNSQYYQRENSVSRRMFDERRHLPPRYPSTQQPRFMQRRPRPREYYDYDDEFEHERSFPYESSRRRSLHPLPKRTTSRYGGDHYSQEISDEEFYFQHPRQYGLPRRGSYYDDTRHSSRMSLNRRESVNGLADFGSQVGDIPKVKTIAKVEVDSHQPAAVAAEQRSPAKTLKRTESVNEAKQRYFTNLKSNIFHNNAEYSNIIEHKKPLSVRDFAASQRVGVGLPDIEFC